MILSSGTISAPSPSLCPSVAFTEANEQYKVALDVIMPIHSVIALESEPISLSNSLIKSGSSNLVPEAAKKTLTSWPSVIALAVHAIPTIVFKISFLGSDTKFTKYFLLMKGLEEIAI